MPEGEHPYHVEVKGTDDGLEGTEVGYPHEQPTVQGDDEELVLEDDEEVNQIPLSHPIPGDLRTATLAEVNFL